MSVTKVEFEYAIGESVAVRAIQMIGKVDSMSIDINGLMYRVIYWNDGTRHQTWLYPWEIIGENGGTKP